MCEITFEDKWLRKLYTQKVILKEIVQFPNLQKFVIKLKFNGSGNLNSNLYNYWNSDVNNFNKIKNQIKYFRQLYLYYSVY
jgi:hypothetical protein